MPLPGYAVCLAASLFCVCASASSHVLRYDKPAASSVKGWERESIPLGCAHFGVSVFGDPAGERLQVTHNAVHTGDKKRRNKANLTNALEIYLDFPVEEYADFENIYWTTAGCTVSCHCGPGTLGVLFVRK